MASNVVFSSNRLIFRKNVLVSYPLIRHSHRSFMHPNYRKEAAMTKDYPTPASVGSKRSRTVRLHMRLCR